MKRILEPEYMDTSEESDSYDAMDNSAANARVVDDFLAFRATCVKAGTAQALGGSFKHVLDLGTGPADIPILLADRVAELRLVGVDAAATMLDIARPKVQSAGYASRIELHQADVKALPFEDGSFDAVFSNTILHHIPRPSEFLAEAKRVLAADGILFVRDLVRPSSEAALQALVNEHVANGTPSHKKLFAESLHAALTLDELRHVADSVGLQDAKVEQTSDRHVTITRAPN